MNEKPKPWLSVITVCFNDSKNLLLTLQSVRDQQHDLIQSIVIDGGSEDMTLSVIHSNKDIISDWISEPDKGLYDAMNKGMKLARSEYLLFLNAGDVFHNSFVVTQAKLKCGNEDVLYGNAVIVNEDGSPKGYYHKITPPQLTWRDFRYGMVVNHQALFVKTSIAAQYDLSYKISSDIDWAIRTIKQAKTIKNLNLVICDFQTGGLSTKKRGDALLERWKILRIHFGLRKAFLNHLIIISKFIFKSLKSGY